MRYLVMDYFFRMYESLITLLFFNQLFQRKNGDTTIHVCKLVAATFLASGLMYFAWDQVYLVKCLLFLSLHLYAVNVLYESKWYVKSSFLLFLVYLFYITDILFSSIMALCLKDNIINIFHGGFPNRLFTCTIIKLTDTLFFYVLYRALKKIDFDIRRRLWLLPNIISLIFLSITIFLVSFYPSQKLDNTLALLLIVLSVGFFTMSLIIIYFFVEIYYYFQNEKLAYHLKNSYDKFTEQAAVQWQTKKITERIFHDWKTIMSTIIQLLQKNDVPEAMSLLEQLVLEMNGMSNEGCRSGNGVIDTIISYKFSLCASHGVRCSCEIGVLPDVILSTMDMTSLLSNLIDNAMDAAEKSLMPFIEIKVFKYKGYACFIVKNSHANRIKLEGSVLKTTKIDKQMHGFGTRIISEIADRHDGSFTYEFDDETFTATVLIPVLLRDNMPDGGAV